MEYTTKTALLPHASRLSQVLALLSFLLIFFVSGYYLKNFTIPSYPIEAYGLIFAAVSAVILAALAILYYFAYRFYEDSFYLFIAVGWFGNVVHIFFETFFIASWNDFHYSLRVALLSALLMVPFYLAGLTYKGEGSKYKSSLYITIGWLIWFCIAIPLALTYVYSVNPNLTEPQKFKLIVGPSVPFSLFTLWMIGKRLQERLSVITHGHLKSLFPATFYAYALLQPIYLFKLDVEWRSILMAAFGVALILKITNGLSGLASMYRDYSTMQKNYAAAQTIFERERAELELAQAKLQQKSAMEELGLLTSSIQHDIRNPLIVIESEVDRLKEKLQAQPELVKRLEYINEQKVRIFEATTLVPLLRGADSYFQKLMQKVTLDDLVPGTIKAVKREMNTSEIYFRINKEHPNIKHVFARAYGPLLEQGLVNVLKNSVEAIRDTKNRSGVIDIDFGNADSQGMVQIVVTDNGRGISAEDLPKVKSVFTTRDEQKANSGLGLFITNRIVEVHGGKLQITSDDGSGTQVSLVVPKWVG